MVDLIVIAGAPGSGKTTIDNTAPDPEPALCTILDLASREDPTDVAGAGITPP